MAILNFVYCLGPSISLLFSPKLTFSGPGSFNMSSTHKLPSSPREWRDLVVRNDLTDSTIHTADLSSASTIEEDQYLLFRVLWKVRPIQQFDWKRFNLDKWEGRANELLANYSSWKAYCDGLAVGTVFESTFALAHYFQLQATNTSDETLVSNVVITPIAYRTRSKTDIERQLHHMHLQTPTKSTGLLPDDSDSEELDDTESPPMSKSPSPEEIRNLMNRQTKDEQIVNTALVNFLSALTLHSGLPNHWTLHRKSFKACFTHASFEARTDGYLEDTKPDGKIRALIEVKAVAREKKEKQFACRKQLKW